MTTVGGDHAGLTLQDLHLCFEGVVPAVIATASADGTPNVTYLSRVCLVDDDHVALSNQFFSKTSRNLAENPRASLLLIDPTTYAQYRLSVAYERTERRGQVFERLRHDVDVVASLSGMQDVFKLRAADVYRVVRIERVLTVADRAAGTVSAGQPPSSSADGGRLDAETLAELNARLARCSDLDTLVSTALGALDELFGPDPLAVPPARRAGHPPVHHRHARLHGGGRRLGGEAGQRDHRDGCGPLHHHPGGQPAPDGQVLPVGPPVLRGPGGRGPGPHPGRARPGRRREPGGGARTGARPTGGGTQRRQPRPRGLRPDRRGLPGRGGLRPGQCRRDRAGPGARPGRRRRRLTPIGRGGGPGVTRRRARSRRGGRRGCASSPWTAAPSSTTPT